ncbi:unnamed protein product, partial [Gulo gulo]
GGPSVKNTKGRHGASRHQWGVFEVNCGLRYAIMWVLSKRNQHKASHEF